MTPGTGKRSYRACQRCRSRKTRCDLNGFGESGAPPCVSCHHSGSRCVLAGSQRGGNFRPYQPRTRLSVRAQGEKDDQRNLIPTKPYIATDDLGVELRNPSDALQILAQSSQISHDVSPSYSPRSISCAGATNGRVQGYDADALKAAKKALYHQEATGSLENYALIERGLLQRDDLLKLLQIFAQRYHQYCPITPTYMLRPSTMENIRESDYFLLTIILVIASRDSPTHVLTHRYCWDHTQRLLLDVLLAQPWTQTPRTVEGLLLLSEWLPHIQMSQTSSEDATSLLSEDRSSWSLVGLAVRHAYLMRLDRAAFRNYSSQEANDQVEHKRIVWTFVYLADRQISVRLGQSFWSRGPSLSSHFTAKDFASLQGLGGEDYASVLQATLELTQILHNAHGILYSSRERTLALVTGGEYSRYLDDFQNAATMWHSAWCRIGVASTIRATLDLMYEYLCLYVNAFSFQAVLTRLHPAQKSSPNSASQPEAFPCGIMSSPDGLFIFNAIDAATKTLKIINKLHPGDELRYFPSRYYLYGVYAAVFLYKGYRARAFTGLQNQQEVVHLVQRFTVVLDEAASGDSHVGRRYSQVLGRLWQRQVPITNKRLHIPLQNPSTDNCGSAHDEADHAAFGEEIASGSSFCDALDFDQPLSLAPSLDIDLFGPFLCSEPDPSYIEEGSCLGVQPSDLDGTAALWNVEHSI